MPCFRLLSPILFCSLVLSGSVFAQVAAIGLGGAGLSFGTPDEDGVLGTIDGLSGMKNDQGGKIVSGFDSVSVQGAVVPVVLDEIFTDDPVSHVAKVPYPLLLTEGKATDARVKITVVP